MWFNIIAFGKLLFSPFSFGDSLYVKTFDQNGRLTSATYSINAEYGLNRRLTFVAVMPWGQKLQSTPFKV
jgi:hypothetical protein